MKKTICLFVVLSFICGFGVFAMANPASVNCVDKGYKNEIRTNADGSQYGVCVLGEGKECEEWAFFRGECGTSTPAAAANIVSASAALSIATLKKFPFLAKERMKKLSSAEKHIEIKYPETKSKGLNKKINAYINLILKDFADNTKEAVPAGSNWTYELLANYQIFTHSQNIVSVRFETYQFTGGAHGMVSVNVINYDLKTNKEIVLTDVFNSNTKYLAKISTIVIPKLKKKIENPATAWVDDGAKPTKANYSVYYLTKDQIVFYFSQYQVAPYANGDFEIGINFRDLKSVLNKKFRIKYFSKQKPQPRVGSRRVRI